eukprot:3193511-Heterocapsa_arctica.AAC.1
MSPPTVSANRSAPPRLADDLLGVSSRIVSNCPSSSLPRATATARITAVMAGSPSDLNRRRPRSPSS